jgi:hypothetical protein
MSIRKGDRITIGIAPTVQLAQYSYVKPSATVSRDILSGDAEGIEIELEGMMNDLKRLIVRATLTELGLSSDLHAAVAEGTEGLAEFCRKELGYVESEVAGQADPPIPGKGDPAAQDRPRAKAAGGGGPVRKPGGPQRR